MRNDDTHRILAETIEENIRRVMRMLEEGSMEEIDESRDFDMEKQEEYKRCSKLAKQAFSKVITNNPNRKYEAHSITITEEEFECEGLKLEILKHLISRCDYLCSLGDDRSTTLIMDYHLLQ